jgi:hypothetical protein
MYVDGVRKVTRATVKKIAENTPAMSHFRRWKIDANSETEIELSGRGRLSALNA